MSTVLGVNVMSLVKVSTDVVKYAQTAAMDALKDEPGFWWITKSALLERAYLMGISNALGAISEKDDENTFFIKTFSETLWERKADDSFTSTPLGKDYSTIREAALGGKAPAPAEIDELIFDINRLNDKWCGAVRMVLQELSVIKSLRSKANPQSYEIDGEITGILRYLDDVFRLLALLETSHKLKDRLGE